MNINKRAMEYAKMNNYYRPSKIKIFLKLFDKKVKKLEEGRKPSICPECGGECNTIEYCDREFYYDAYMYCNACGNCYDDDEYMNQEAELENLNYFDRIEMIVWGNKMVPGKGYKWFEFCDKEMDRMIKNLGYDLIILRRS